MLHALVEEARSLLAQLTIADKGGVDELPPIAWDRMEDDHSEDGAGYSFLGSGSATRSTGAYRTFSRTRVYVFRHVVPQKLPQHRTGKSHSPLFAERGWRVIGVVFVVGVAVLATGAGGDQASRPAQSVFVV
jgi:hypothetical protein